MLALRQGRPTLGKGGPWHRSEVGRYDSIRCKFVRCELFRCELFRCEYSSVVNPSVLDASVVNYSVMRVHPLLSVVVWIRQL